MPLPPPPPQSEHARTVFRNNLDGENAWQRHQRYVRSAQLYNQGAAGSSSQVSRRNDFDALKDAHQFIRDDDEDISSLSYDDAIAVKYYRSLFKEYACCDLKHYKTGAIALRWRTEREVISGAGQFTCGNTRCACHEPASMRERQPPQLVTLELPFAYVEQGEQKSALVKVVLCRRCRKKLTWKRDQEKALGNTGGAGGETQETDRSPGTSKSPDKSRGGEERDVDDEIKDENSGLGDEYAERRSRDRRSASPSRRIKR